MFLWWIMSFFFLFTLCFELIFSLQDIPLHAALLTHLLIAWDRMRWLNDAMNARFPAFVCSCATWLTGMVIALPYPIYTTYLDLGVSCFNEYYKLPFPGRLIQIFIAIIQSKHSFFAENENIIQIIIVWFDNMHRFSVEI